MSVESEDSNVVFVPKVDLISCPFLNLCELPKHHFLCKVPDCKVLCSDYLTRVRNLNREGNYYK